MVEKKRLAVFLDLLAPALLLAAGLLTISACNGKAGESDARDVDGEDGAGETENVNPECLGDYQSCGTGCYQVCDCSHEKVSAAIDAAPAESTVHVPAGSCTWSSNLTITKGLTLQGNGAGNTVITSDYNATNPGNTFAEGNFLIVYRPASPESNEPLRLTGFTFDFANKCGGILLTNPTAAPIDRVRVDHNMIQNAAFSGGSARAMIVGGTVYGVIDNNTFSGNASDIDAYGNNETSWDNLTFAFGGADCMYYEDNTFTISDTPHAGGAGGRYCARYNTYTHVNSSAGMYPWFDMHGNMGEGGNYSTMGAEIYGNVVTMTNNNGVGMFDQRGGKAVIFDNKVNTTASCSAKAREEFDDSLNPTTSPQPQHVSDSYYWNNRAGTTLVTAPEPIEASGTATGGGDDFLDDAGADFDTGFGGGRYGLVIHGGTGAGQSRLIVGATSTRLTVTPSWDTNPDATSQYRIVDDCCDAIDENREFYNLDVAFDGTTGMGCGTLASRPAACTVGVGYWATDQDCSIVPDESTGAHPAAPISGTLYTCSAPDTWTQYFTPHPYPHPLRGE